MILEISKYLTLNDAVRVFSPEIVLKIKENRWPVHISNKPELFIPMVLEHLDGRRIQSLSLDFLEMESTNDFENYQDFRDIRSLDLRNFQTAHQITAALNYFRNAEYCSLWFDDESIVDGLFHQDFFFSWSTTHVEIHCPGAICYHAATETIGSGASLWRPGTTVRSLLFDFGCFPLPSADECPTYGERCCLNWIVNRMSVFVHLEVLRIRVSSFHVEKLLFADLWRSTVQRCPQVHRVVIDLLDHSNDEAIQTKAATIENDLRSMRPNFRFRIKLI